MDAKPFVKILGTIIFFGIIVLFDMPHLLKTNPRINSVVAYFLLIGICLTISILLISGLEITSPAMVIEKIVRLIIPGKPVQ